MPLVLVSLVILEGAGPPQTATVTGHGPQLQVRGIAVSGLRCLADLFRRLDRDGDGRLDATELRPAPGLPGGFALEPVPSGTLGLDEFGKAFLAARRATGDEMECAYAAELTRARQLSAAGDLRGARRVLEAVVARDPTEREARLALAELLADCGQPAEAAAHYGAVLAAHPRDVVALLQLVGLERRLWSNRNDRDDGPAVPRENVARLPSNSAIERSPSTSPSGTNAPTASSQPGRSPAGREPLPASSIRRSSPAAGGGR